ncbi:MAG TPA: sugar MFS transporter [Acidobacteriaceae bacterium]|jgi:FHS family L-fucose permease-like MFS transporter|nr:sugar MFS transporter [Acidobacteriaceae bacterium]
MALSGISQNEGFVSEAPATTNVRAMTIVTALFFMWGFITCLNDILIPHLKSIFELNYFRVMLVQFAFFSSYAIFAWPSGKVVEWVGYKRSLVIGLVVMAVGALMFLPASAIPSFGIFLTALVCIAAGMTLLQVSANPYVANLGPPQTASSRLNLAQAFNSLGTTVAPFFGGALILTAATLTPVQLHSLSAALQQQYRMQQASSVRIPYVGLAIALVALAVALALLHLPDLHFTQEMRPGASSGAATRDSIWRHPQLLFAAIGIFVYVGAEVSIGSFLINYMELPNIGHLAEKTAASFVAVYWGGAMIGRFIGSAMLTRIRTGTLLAIAAAIAGCLVVTSILTHGYVAMFTVLAVGLFNSIMFPSIFTLGIDGLGALTSRGSSLLVAAIFGGAALPLLQGRLADAIGVQHALMIPVICYVYILIFGAMTKDARPAQTPEIAPV